MVSKSKKTKIKRTNKKNKIKKNRKTIQFSKNKKTKSDKILFSITKH